MPERKTNMPVCGFNDVSKVQIVYQCHRQKEIPPHRDEANVSLSGFCLLGGV